MHCEKRVRKVKRSDLKLIKSILCLVEKNLFIYAVLPFCSLLQSSAVLEWIGQMILHDRELLLCGYHTVSCASLVLAVAPCIWTVYYYHATRRLTQRSSISLG